MPEPDTDILIIGGGPAGAACGTFLARDGWKVRIVEQDSFPRFHVGESLLPELTPIFERLGVHEKLYEIPHVVKTGAEFGFAWQQQGALFDFSLAAPWGRRDTLNVERAHFDRLLLDNAREAGCEVQEEVKVTGVVRLKDGDCEIQTSSGNMTAGLIIDCSGQAAILGRLLKLKQVFPGHRKTAFMGHFTGVERLKGDAAGYPTIVMADEGWFWMIPIDQERMSIGLVLDKEAIQAMRKEGVKAGQELSWAIPRAPLVARRTADAVFPDKNGVVADFSYHCEPYTDDGYIMVGDSAAFLDPVFSSGLYLALAGAESAAEAAGHIMRRQNPQQARQSYINTVEKRKTVFFHYIRAYYCHAFREMLIEGHGPLGVHRALIAFLTGKVHPLPLPLKWRLKLMDFFHRRHQSSGRIVKQRNGYSLLAQAETPRAQAISTLLNQHREGF